MFIQRKLGFTIVELLSVIVVIGILAGLSTVVYNGVATKAVDVQLRADLNKVGDWLEIDYLDDRKYPATLAETNNGNGADVSEGTVLAYIPSSDGTTYCLAASSLKTTNTYRITNDSPIQAGGCPAVPAAPAPATLSGSGYCYSIGADGEGSITLTWPASSKWTAPAYRIYQTGTQNTQIDVINSNTSTGNISKTFTVGPMAYSVGGTYTYVVRAINSVGAESSDSPSWNITFAPYEC